MSGLKRIGDLLRAHGARLGLGPWLLEAEVLSAWCELFGPSEVYRPEKFRGGTLVVAARSAAAAQDLLLRREAVREALNRRLKSPLVRRIRVVPRGWEE
jgi:predicted nucleic acid-binding Zn ribbon protein